MNAPMDLLGSGLWAIVSLVVLLGAIITVHEWGHFFVARLCGVHVIRFSIGFGKPLWSRIGRNGTEYVVAALPLGGYVRMLDEREGDVPADRLREAFNRKPVAQRFAIVAAGPLVNLLFAVLLYWVLFIVGSQQMAPVVGRVVEHSPAAIAGLEAGDEILAIDGEGVTTWDDIPLRLVARIGDSGDILFRVRGNAMMERDVRVPVSGFMHGREDGNPGGELGIAPWLPDVPAVVGQVMGEIRDGDRRIPGPAATAGLKAGDRILSVGGQPVPNWSAWVDAVRAAPERTLALEVERDGQVLDLSLVPGRKMEGSQAVGIAGVVIAPLRWPQDWPAEYLREVRYGPVEALGRAVKETWQRSVLTVQSIGKMVSGAMSVKSVGGPIAIARGAGATASAGLDAFIGFMAFLSISIGILNLLPVPVLDGGHLVFYAVEAVRGRPVGERVQQAALNVGIALLLALMCLAFYNDFARLWSQYG